MEKTEANQELEDLIRVQKGRVKRIIDFENTRPVPCTPFKDGHIEFRLLMDLILAANKLDEGEEGNKV